MNVLSTVLPLAFVVLFADGVVSCVRSLHHYNRYTTASAAAAGLADALILINLTLRLNWSINVPLRVGLLIVQQCL